MFCVSSDLNSGKKVRLFHFRGGGGFCVRSDLNSGKKVRLFPLGGGHVRVSSDLNSGKKEFFIFWGGVFCAKFQNRVFC